METLHDEEILEIINEGQESKLYRTIVPLNTEKDKNKSGEQLCSEIFSHSEDKCDINRNMLAAIFARDPLKFKD